jgi:hypothetical protein
MSSLFDIESQSVIWFFSAGARSHGTPPHGVDIISQPGEADKTTAGSGRLDLRNLPEEFSGTFSISKLILHSRQSAVLAHHSGEQTVSAFPQKLRRQS